MVLTVVAALMLGFGVPMLWTWIASTIGSGRQLSPALWVFAGVGILVTYWLLLLVGGRFRGRSGGDQAPTIRRHSWNRSMRDEPFRPGSGRSDPVERIFLLAATFGFVAFLIWVVFFAGAPCAGPCGTVG